MTDAEARKWACHHLGNHLMDTHAEQCVNCGASAIEVMQMRVGAHDLAEYQRNRHLYEQRHKRIMGARLNAQPYTSPPTMAGLKQGKRK